MELQMIDYPHCKLEALMSWPGPAACCLLLAARCLLAGPSVHPSIHPSGLKQKAFHGAAARRWNEPNQTPDWARAWTVNWAEFMHPTAADLVKSPPKQAKPRVIE